MLGGVRCQDLYPYAGPTLSSTLALDIKTHTKVGQTQPLLGPSCLSSEELTLQAPGKVVARCQEDEFLSVLLPVVTVGQGCLPSQDGQWVSGRDPTWSQGCLPRLEAPLL